MAKPMNETRRASRERVERLARSVADMTPEERRRELDAMQEEIDQWAPTPESAGSDLLRMLIVVGTEFVRRYYPDAETASFGIHGPGRLPGYTAYIPVMRPAAEPEPVVAGGGGGS